MSDTLLDQAGSEAALKRCFDRRSPALAPIDPKRRFPLVILEGPANGNTSGRCRQGAIFSCVCSKFMKHHSKADGLPRTQLHCWTDQAHPSRLTPRVRLKLDCNQILERRLLPRSARE